MIKCKYICSEGVRCSQQVISIIDKNSKPKRMQALTGRKPHWANDSIQFTYHWVHDREPGEYCFYHTQVVKGLLQEILKGRKPNEFDVINRKFNESFSDGISL